MSGAYVPGAKDPLDEEEASRRVAEENLAKSFFEQMDAAVPTPGQFRVTMGIPRDLSISMVEKALDRLREKYPHMKIAVTWMPVPSRLFVEF